MIDVSRGLIETGTPWQNWGRSILASPRFAARAMTVADVIETVGFARERGLSLKTVGAGHSFTGIAATDGVRLDISGLTGLIAVNGTRVTVGAGTLLHDLSAQLEPLGLALANLGDIDVQTVAGAISTGTHGTGARWGGLATQVRAVTLVTAAGEVLHVSETEHAELLPAVKLGLGALGVIVAVEIECVPSFVLQAVERPEGRAAVLAEWEERVESSDHFEFYVWPHTAAVSTKTNTRLPADASLHPLGPVREWFDDRLMSNTVYSASLRVLAAVPALVPPMNRLSAKLQGDRDFTDLSSRVFASPRTVRFREMEYGLPRDRVPEAVEAVLALIERRGWRISFPIEVRASAADDLWLSTAHGRATGYIAVHRYFREDPGQYFREVEAIMRDFGGRPHWGKMNERTAADLRPAYPRFDDFLAVRDRLDPERLFTNDYLERVLGP